MNTFGAAWVLASKDLKSFVRDRASLSLSILVPIALVTVFGWIMAYAFGGSSGMPKVTLHVIDEAKSNASERVLKQLQKHEMLRVKSVTLKESEPAKNANEVAAKLVRDGDANHVLILHAPTDSSEASLNQSLVRDPGRQMEDRIVQIALMQVNIQEQGDKVLLNGVENLLTREGMAPEDIQSIRGWANDIGDTFSDFFAKDELAQAADAKESSQADQSNKTELPTTNLSESDATESKDDEVFDLESFFRFAREIMPIEMVDVQPPGRKQQVTYQQAQSVCGMSVMMLLFALSNCGSVLLTERENGTLRRLFSQPISRNSILLGKFLFVFAVGMLQMTVLFCYGEWMFRVGLFRDPVSLFVISFTWIATAGAFGIFLAAVSRSARQAESLASLLILMMAALGGCWFPIQMMNLPPLLDTVCKSTMTYWAMSAYQGLLWNQLAWYSTNTLIALACQWAWCICLTMLTLYFYRRNYCRG